MSKKKKQKIAIAMSGGVDSSVVAKILKDQGHELVGLFLKLWSDPTSSDGLRGASPTCKVEKENRCCNYEALEDARKVASMLKIPFYVIDAKKEFKKEIVDSFLSEYKNLRTPNPCIVCNEKIKFDLLLKKAMAIGCEKLATGHYARIENAGISNSKFLISKQISNNQITNFKLLKGIDETKDQSYMLYRLNQHQLSKVLFPLGEMTKKEVRKLAVKWDLPVKEKPESQEICFFADRDYRQFLRRHLALKYFKSGDIVDKMGNVIGCHDGLLNYTIGQRKGIEQSKVKSEKLKVDGKIKSVISRRNDEKSHNKKPLYVIGFNVKKNQLIVGEDEYCYKSEMVVGNLNFIQNDALFRHAELVSGSQIKVKIRYRHPDVGCEISLVSSSSGLTRGSIDSKKLLVDSRIRGNDGNIKVIFDQPQRAITPGQSAVFYGRSPSREAQAKWDEVLGGGIIEE